MAAAPGFSLYSYFKAQSGDGGLRFVYNSLVRVGLEERWLRFMEMYSAGEGHYGVL